MRQILQLEIHGTTLVGTYHQPDGDPSDPGASDGPHGGVGILFFNTGDLPRAAGGDLGVQLGDRLGKLGYHVFRFDLPGLGDTPGEPPEYEVLMYNFLKQRGHVTYATGLISNLMQTYGLRGMVLAGNCGGAITGVYAGALMPERVLGVIQLDPDLRSEERFEVKGTNGTTAAPGLIRRAGSLLAGAGQAVRKGVLRIPLTKRVAQGLHRIIVMRGLPRFSNVRLFKCWKQLMVAKVPMLVLVCNPIQGDEHLEYLLRRYPQLVTAVEVEDTDHMFASDAGKATVCGNVERWLLAHVPVASKADVEPACVGGEKVLSQV